MTKKNNIKKIIAMIPARIGSKRLKYKNLSIINKKSLITYSILAAKKSKIFDDIIINSDSNIFEKIAKKYKVNFYLRPKKLGKSNIKSDDVVLDFINKFECSYIAWVNPIAPLQSSTEIRQTVIHFIKNNYNSLITVNKKNAHVIYNNRPINFKYNSKFDKTQDLKPFYEMVYSLMIWKSHSFKKEMKKNNFAMCHGKFCYFPVNKLSSFIVKNSEDLMIVEKILSSLNKQYQVKYDKLVKTIKTK